jgi:hypothetical protein
MQHVVLSKMWKFEENPFPAYSCELSFGKYKRDFQFLPVLGLSPNEGSIELTRGTFKVIKSLRKGTWLIVRGEDLSNKCLLFVGEKSGYRGSLGLLKYDMTGIVIKECVAGNKKASSHELVALLEPGQNVVFRSFNKDVENIIEYLWNGKRVIKSTIPRQVWEERKKK